MPRVSYFVLVFSVFVITSCDSNGLYEDNISTPNNTWNEKDVARFSVPISDTISNLNIYVNVRNTTDYPNCNLFLFIMTSSPSGATKLDTVECFLADEQGNWLGKGFGYLRDNQVLYKRNIRFPLKGNYTFEIKQAMRTDDLKGIASVGLRIEKSNLR